MPPMFWSKRFVESQDSESDVVKVALWDLSLLKMPPMFWSKIFVESQDSRSDVVEVA